MRYGDMFYLVTNSRVGGLSNGREVVKVERNKVLFNVRKHSGGKINSVASVPSQLSVKKLESSPQDVLAGWRTP